ncbi:hypothetical protein COCON_G00075010 [Conger conger]|uniref:Uncharacterized protein n=1 Tax=Conger conger TaxID=82655 RepID=A0A9Q1I0B4_CONCO|nr:hypothetical protein COCON_G00075010 [Conger conger]
MEAETENEAGVSARRRKPAAALRDAGKRQGADEGRRGAIRAGPQRHPPRWGLPLRGPPNLSRHQNHFNAPPTGLSAAPGLNRWPFIGHVLETTEAGCQEGDGSTAFQSI